MSETDAEKVSHGIAAIVSSCLFFGFVFQTVSSIRRDAFHGALAREDMKRSARARSRTPLPPVSARIRQCHYFGVLVSTLFCIRSVDPLGKLVFDPRWMRFLSFNTTALTIIFLSLMLDLSLHLSSTLGKLEKSMMVKHYFASAVTANLLGANVFFAIYISLPPSSAKWGYAGYLLYLIAVETAMVTAWHFNIYRINKAIQATLNSSIQIITSPPSNLSANGSEASQHSSAGLRPLSACDGGLHATAPDPFPLPPSPSSACHSVPSPPTPSSGMLLVPLSTHNPAEPDNPNQQHSGSAFRVSTVGVDPISSSVTHVAVMVSTGQQKEDPAIARSLHRLTLFSRASHVAVFVAIASQAYGFAVTAAPSSSDEVQSFRFPLDMVYFYLTQFVATCFLAFSWQQGSITLLTHSIKTLVEQYSTPNLK